MPLAMKSTTNQRREHVGYNSVAIFIRLAVVAPKSAKSSEILRKFELRAVQGHPRSLILVSKAHIQLPISYSVLPVRRINFIINSNHGRIYCRFRDIDVFISKIARISTSPLLDATWRRNALQNQCNLYTAEKYI